MRVEILESINNKVRVIAHISLLEPAKKTSLIRLDIFMGWNFSVIILIFGPFLAFPLLFSIFL